METDDLKTNIRTLVFGRDGRSVFCQGHPMTVLTWHVETKKQEILEKNADPLTSSIFNAFTVSPDGALLAWTDTNATVVWDVKQSKRIQRFKKTTPFAFSADGAKFAAGDGHSIRVWDVKTGDSLTPTERNRSSVVGVTFAPDVKTAFTFEDLLDSRLVQWKLDGTIERTRDVDRYLQSRHQGFARSGNLLAVARFESFNVYKLPDFPIVKTISYPSSDDWGEAIALSPDGKTFAAAFRNKPEDLTKKPEAHVQLFDAISGKAGKKIDPELNRIEQMRFSPDGKGLLIRGRTYKQVDDEFAPDKHKHKLCFRDLDADTFRFVVELDEESGFLSVEFSKDGSSFAMADGYRNVVLRDAKTGKKLRTLHDGKKAPATALAMAPRSGVMALAVGYHRTAVIEIWDLSANKKLHTFEGAHRGAVRSLAFSDDEALLISGSDDTTAMVWDFKGIVK
jgi:WD40 repeat protein